MSFVKNIFKGLSLFVLSLSLVTLFMISNAQAATINPNKVDHSIEPETAAFENASKSADHRGLERAQNQLKKTENDNRASFNEPSPRGRDLRAYDEDASIGEKFSDTVGNASRTFKEATESVLENNQS
ncbi:hypothetical protein [Chroococcus sp. FPU101]|uniref:hypothetical protein n=1 Tax=Chroococcus sp. FPU101 TaxID=1974212 RepID=UPI001A8F352D|nr:hypothetical protein [Chroococcus sp. FPU101]GFE70129.1 hypothetical protein CFPU101_27390 [Chroococcus sp. FPU101]